jgi:hypothetical protein
LAYGFVGELEKLTLAPVAVHVNEFTLRVEQGRESERLQIHLQPHIEVK